MNNYIKKIIYLGPIGTNSEFAANEFMKKTGINAELEPISTITKVIETLDNKEDDSTIAILPIENSIEGIVRETIDNLVKTSSEIFIQAEFSIPISHCLMSKGKKEEIKVITSISQAVMQCKEYIANNFDKVDVVLYTSTSAAAQFAAQKGGSYGAIASERCASMYGLNVIEKNINDVKDNKTNFIALSKKKLFKSKETRTLIAFTTENKPGALLEILAIFKKHNLNMLYLESRPSKKVFGEYIFYTEIDRGIEDINEVLFEIKEKSDFLRILGSYCIL